jgi:hypothetical protein
MKKDCRTCAHGLFPFTGGRPGRFGPKHGQCTWNNAPGDAPLSFEMIDPAIFCGKVVFPNYSFEDYGPCFAWTPSPRLGPKARAKIGGEA